MAPKGSLVRVMHPAVFYEREEMNFHDYHFDLRRGELIVYLGEINPHDYVKCMARGVIGWVSGEAVQWV